MNNRHKYFRKLRHQEKLAGKGEGCWKTYWSHTMYFTEEADPRDLREHSQQIYWRAERLGSIEAAIEEYINHDKINGKFIYYNRPEVPYTIHKVHTSPSYSRRRKDYKKYSNKRVRQGWKQRNEEYQHCEYKKVFGIAWELD